MTDIPGPLDDLRTPAWIVDIDGTLAHRTCLTHDLVHQNPNLPVTDPDCKFRYPYDDEREELILSDGLDSVVSELVNLLYNNGYSIVVCSGRSEISRTATQKWLQKHKIPYDNLFMRPAKDNRKDSIVKLELLDKYILPTYDVRGVLDDRNQVVDAWRSRGLKVLQVEPGDF